MRGRKTYEEMTKVTIRVFSKDLEMAHQFFPHIGYNEILRTLLRSTVRSCERRRLDEFAKGPHDLSPEIQDEITNHLTEELVE